MIKRYEHGDMATFYFIINKYSNGHKEIQAWTDSKDLAKIYMDFHKCKRFTLKVVTDTIDEINQLTEENIHDEIEICNIFIRDRGKKYDTVKQVSIPATTTETMFLNEEANTYMASRISYSSLNDIIPFLKNKYQKALRDILLNDVIAKVVHNQNPKSLQNIEFDYLMMLYRSFPDNFGR